MSCDMIHLVIPLANDMESSKFTALLKTFSKTTARSALISSPKQQLERYIASIAACIYCRIRSRMEVHVDNGDEPETTEMVDLPILTVQVAAAAAVEKEEEQADLEEESSAGTSSESFQEPNEDSPELEQAVDDNIPALPPLIEEQQKSDVPVREVEGLQLQQNATGETAAAVFTYEEERVNLTVDEHDSTTAALPPLTEKEGDVLVREAAQQQLQQHTTTTSIQYEYAAVDEAAVSALEEQLASAINETNSNLEDVLPRQQRQRQQQSNNDYSKNDDKQAVPFKIRVSQRPSRRSPAPEVPPPPPPPGYWLTDNSISEIQGMKQEYAIEEEKKEEEPVRNIQVKPVKERITAPPATLLAQKDEQKKPSSMRPLQRRSRSRSRCFSKHNSKRSIIAILGCVRVEESSSSGNAENLNTQNQRNKRPKSGRRKDIRERSRSRLKEKKKVRRQKRALTSPSPRRRSRSSPTGRSAVVTFMPRSRSASGPRLTSYRRSTATFLPRSKSAPHVRISPTSSNKKSTVYTSDRAMRPSSGRNNRLIRAQTETTLFRPQRRTRPGILKTRHTVLTSKRAASRFVIPSQILILASHSSSASTITISHASSGSSLHSNSFRKGRVHDTGDDDVMMRRRTKSAGRAQPRFKPVPFRIGDMVQPQSKPAPFRIGDMAQPQPKCVSSGDRDIVESQNQLSPFRIGEIVLQPQPNPGTNGDMPQSQKETSPQESTSKNFALRMSTTISYIVTNGVSTTVTGRYSGPLNAQGEMHGNGVFQFSNGSLYLGEFENGQLQGAGALTLRFDHPTADGKTEALFLGFFRANRFMGGGPTPKKQKLKRSNSK